MNKIIFTCETITPLILGEAKKGEVELRPPAIKAAMRFWWRAMHTHLNLSDLQKFESDIFGGGGESCKRSKFEILIRGLGENSKNYDYENYNTIKINEVAKGINTGLQYLMYTFFFLKKKGKYFSPGTKFEIIFYSSESNLVIINQIVASFWLLIFLGNIGERSRRGFGGFKVTSIVDPNNLINGLNFYDFNIPNFRNGLELVYKIFNPNSTPSINNSYSHIYNKNIYCSNNSFSNWKDALSDIGAKMKAFRLNANNKAILAKNESAVFGLPIKHSDNFLVLPENPDLTRRASPIILKVIKLQNNDFRWIIVNLEGDFLPDGANNLIQKKGRQIGPEIGIANDIILTNFLNHLNLEMTKL